MALDVPIGSTTGPPSIMLQADDLGVEVVPEAFPGPWLIGKSKPILLRKDCFNQPFQFVGGTAVGQPSHTHRFTNSNPVPITNQIHLATNESPSPSLRGE